jgi:flagellar protein FliS
MLSTNPVRPPQTHRGAGAYAVVEAQSRSPLELVVMLYDGAIRFAAQARDAHQRGDRFGRAAGVSRAMAIVAELQNTLDVDNGREIASDLDRLYHYIMGRLLDVTRTGDPAALEETVRLLSTLRDGWVQLSAATSARS